MSAEAHAYARAVGGLGSMVERLCVTHDVDREPETLERVRNGAGR